MDLLCLALLFVGAGMALVITVMLNVTRRAGHAAITRNFQDAEHILAAGRPPPAWSRESWWQGLLRVAGRRDPTRQNARHLRRLDALIAFFEHSTFFADEEARRALLRQLREVQVRWRQDLGAAASSTEVSG